jgi:hypothetical protein
MAQPAQSTLQYAVDQQALWSAAASRARRRIDAWRAVALELGVAGAIAATLATQVGAGGWATALRIVAAVALALVPVVLARRTGTQALQAWTRMRSVAEGLKTEQYLYLTGVPPYAAGDADVRLARRVESVTDSASDLVGELVGLKPPTKQPPAVDDIETYVEHRVRQQIDGYYEPRAAHAWRQASWARRAVFGLTLIGAGLGAVAASLGGDSAADVVGAWVPVATTVAVAVTAHAASARYEQIAVTYLQTARQLDRLVRRWQLERAEAAAQAPENDAELVRACEDVISLENQAWMARWNASPES